MLVVEVPDELLEREWRSAVEQRETTATLEEWRAEQAPSALGYLSGWWEDPAVRFEAP